MGPHTFDCVFAGLPVDREVPCASGKAKHTGQVPQAGLRSPGFAIVGVTGPGKGDDRRSSHGVSGTALSAMASCRFIWVLPMAAVFAAMDRAMRISSAPGNFSSFSQLPIQSRASVSLGKNGDSRWTIV